MLAQQLRESTSLFDSLEALRHGRAMGWLAGSLLAALALWSLGGWLLAEVTSWLGAASCGVIGAAVLLCGGNAAGILTMDELLMHAPRPSKGLLRAAWAATQQMVLLLLSLGLVYLLVLLGLVVLLLICRLPLLGPWLYTLVFPLVTAASGVALFVLTALVFPLCAPALWRGLDASAGLAQLWVVARERLPLALTWMLVLACIAVVVWAVLLSVLLLGFFVTTSVSAVVLGLQVEWAAAGFGGRSLMAAETSAYAQAAAVGAGALFAAACAVPSLVAMRGACLVYRRALQGLNTAAQEHALRHSFLAGRDKVGGFQAAAVSKSIPASAAVHSPDGVAALSASAAFQMDSPPAPLFGLPSGLAQQSVDVDLGMPSGHVLRRASPCPVCGNTTEPADFYCGHCGLSLR